MKTFRLYALLTTAATYFLIFVGGLVRVSGAGLGCPDWPKCFGRWFPPTSLDQLPAGIDPATFNVTLAWIEYINRLVGVTVGFLILGVALMALKHFRDRPAVLWPSLLAAILVAIQGWQGSQVVSSELEPYIVTIHMVLALIIVSLLIFATLESYANGESATEELVEFPYYSRVLVGVLWVLTIGQIVLGSQVRQRLEILARDFPTESGEQWFARVGAINDLHLIVGLLVAAIMLYAGMIVLRAAAATPVVRSTVWGLIALVLLQAISGVVLMASGLPALTDLFHLWLAAMFVGLLLVLNAIVRGRSIDLRVEARTLRKSAVWIVIAVFLFGVVAWIAIDRAEASRQSEVSRIAVPTQEAA